MASLVYCIPGMTMKSKPSAPTPSARKFLNSCSLCDRNCINLPRPRPNDRLNLSLPSLANGLCTMEPLAPSRPHHRPRDLPDPICSCCRPTIPASFCHGWSSGVCEKGSSTPCISPGTGKELQTLQFIVFYSTKTPPPKQGKYCAETRTPYSNIYSFLDMLARHRRGKPSNPVSLQVWIPLALFPRPRQRWLEWVPRQHCQVQLAALKPREAAQVVRHWLPQEAIGSLIVSKAAPQTPQLVQVG